MQGTRTLCSASCMHLLTSLLQRISLCGPTSSLHCCLQLPATAIHDVSTASIILQNTTAEPQTFEFGVPSGSDLTLSPHVDTLPGGNSLCVLMRYNPKPETAPAVPGAEPAAADAAAVPAAAARATGEEHQQDGQTQVLQACHKKAHALISCRCRNRFCHRLGWHACTAFLSLPCSIGVHQAYQVQKLSLLRSGQCPMRGRGGMHGTSPASSSPQLLHASLPLQSPLR